MRVTKLLTLLNGTIAAAATNQSHSILSSSSQAVKPLVKFKVIYSTNTVDIGDFDVQKAMLSLITASSEDGVELDQTKQSIYKQCGVRGRVQHLDVSFKASGTWGAAGPIGKDQMRFQMLNIAGHMLERLSKPFRWQMYSDCVASDDAVGDHDLPCGFAASRSCEEICDPLDIAECTQFAWAHRIPTQITIAAYNVEDDSLRADALHLKFSSVSNRHGLKCALIVGTFMVAADWVRLDFLQSYHRFAEAEKLLVHDGLDAAMTTEQRLLKDFKNARHNPSTDSFNFSLLVGDSYLSPPLRP